VNGVKSDAAPAAALTPDGYARARRLLMRRIRSPARPSSGSVSAGWPTGSAPIICPRWSERSSASSCHEGGRDDSRAFRAVPRTSHPGAAAIAVIDDAALRAGLSGQKVGLPPRPVRADRRRAIAADELEALPDEIVIERLTAVKGFGRWTAEMFLMFRLP
jgi:hypothetical protein